MEQLASSSDTAAADPWLEAFADNVLDLAWAALERYQANHSGSAPYTLLRLRAAHPDDDSKQLAEKLSQKVGRAIRPDAVRQQLHRARVRFAEMLVRELADGLDQPSTDRIEEELVELGLYEHVRDVLPAD